jgi:hypothetical protein
MAITRQRLSKQVPAYNKEIVGGGVLYAVSADVTGLIPSRKKIKHSRQYCGNRNHEKLLWWRWPVAIYLTGWQPIRTEAINGIPVLGAVTNQRQEKKYELWGAVLTFTLSTLPTKS